MPTGYTAGILDGKITTFPQFAKQCMRAFGATVHMRDDGADAEYTPRVPSDYYTKEIEKAKQSLIDAETISDQVIIVNRKNELEKSRQYHIDGISKVKSDAKIMYAMLVEVGDWEPPTKEHKDIKDFMADQIMKTIEFDCKTKYHDQRLLEVEANLLTINAKSIRKEMIENAKKDFEYYTKKYNSEIENCAKSNKWVSDFINSLPKKLC